MSIPSVAFLYVAKRRRERRREAIARAVWWVVGVAVLPLLFVVFTN